jgi:hypothetical protein
MMEPEYKESVSAKLHAATDVGNGHSDKVSAAFQNDEGREQSLENAQAGILANKHESIQPSHATVQEIHELREQIRSLQMQIAPGLSTQNQTQAPQISAEESEMLQRIEKCLREHSHEWNTQDVLETLTPDMDKIAIARDYLLRSQHIKSRALRYLSSGLSRDRINSDYWLSRLDSSGDSATGDDSGEDDRNQLTAKRREFLKTMELNAEIMTERMVEIRLKRKIRRKEKAELRKRAELERAIEFARAQEAALAKEGQNDELSSSSDEEEPIPIPNITIPQEPIYAKPKINVLDWSLFRDLGTMKESSSCVIDVLVGEPAVEEEVMRSDYWGYNWKTRARTAGKSQTQKSNPVLVSVPRGHDPLPERIRIHSSFVLKILKQFIDPDGATLDVDAPSIVFLRPFKAFALYEPRLREWLKKLEEKNIDKKLEEKNIDKSAVFYGPVTKEGIITPINGDDEVENKSSDELGKNISSTKKSRSEKLN